MEEDLYEILIIKNLDGTASATEKVQLKNWLHKSTSNQALYKEYQKMWTASADAPIIKNLNMEAALASIKAKAKTSKPTPKIRSISFLRKVAAILLPLIVATTALLFYVNQQAPSYTLLPDGTKVWLYKDAQIDYPEAFIATTRQVTLTGEAYFEVARDVNKPFIIEAGKATIKVLGTSFNLLSTPTLTEVIVNTGKVELSAMQAASKVALSKGDRGTYANAQITKRINTDENFLAWHTGQFNFDGDIPIDKAVQQLSKYYGPIDLDISANPDCLLKANFNKEEIATVLEVLRNSCGY